MTEHARDAEAIFFAALDKTTPQGRVAYVEATCVGDPELLRRVRELLSCHEGSQGPARCASSRARVHRGPVRSQRAARHSHRPVQVIAADRRGRHGHRLHGRADPARPAQGRPQGHQAGHGHRQVIARFEAERQALAMMDHVNIARVLDAGATESGRPYFVMELVHGVPITRYCDEQPLDAARAAGAVRAGLPGRSSTPTRRGSSTATSSRPTSWSRSTTASRCPRSSTSAWPRRPGSS